MSHGKIDCIVRFHDLARLNELKRCVFSLVGQTYRPLNVILTLQRFSDKWVAEVKRALDPILGLPDAPTLKVCNFKQPTPPDARSCLLNLGLQSAEGRYIAFLDYDDLLYPEAYTKLIAHINKTGAAIVFASVRVVWVDAFKRFLRVAEEVREPFGQGNNLIDLFQGPFCPLHSYLIDRSQINPTDLGFDTRLAWEEDYEFLLRICARYRSNFDLIKTQVGEYYWKKNGNNTRPMTISSSPETVKAYKRLTQFMEGRRSSTFVSVDVQTDHGILPPDPHLTIQEFVERTRVRQASK